MRGSRVVMLAGVAAVLAGCSVPGPGGAPEGIHDPYETQNRKVHAFNRDLDTRLFSGDGPGYAGVVPGFAQDRISTFADTVSLPQTVVNQLLQGRLVRATSNTMRFTLNATIGVGGLFDVANEWGLAPDDSGFGETLSVWGVPEGAYQELPLLGPSTERDTAGILVDLLTDPVAYVVPKPERYIGTVAKGLDKIGERSQFDGIIESVYASADSYAQLRLMYLQNRRHELGEEAPGGADFDPLSVDTEGF
ncbi:MlaA family lipoprotein [Maliponia aquimaris]|uniref:Putative phospholipid-binding lipoprotein MlaA n=1 Tax=Maliponia aquimaris TaxID=1673631 RepID=A0A238KF37_9RHOB|nr:VacJ family lipoprotein [Maliponia aquimaris]SMX40636.1 putative phospholipid-binding lipoprotein MlaA precursor [Maliponia aquimaris]